jgi:hypothetical protein
MLVFKRKAGNEGKTFIEINAGCISDVLLKVKRLKLYYHLDRSQTAFKIKSPAYLSLPHCSVIQRFDLPD